MESGGVRRSPTGLGQLPRVWMSPVDSTGLIQYYIITLIFNGIWDIPRPRIHQGHVTFRHDQLCSVRVSRVEPGSGHTTCQCHDLHQRPPPHHCHHTTIQRQAPENARTQEREEAGREGARQGGYLCGHKRCAALFLFYFVFTNNKWGGSSPPFFSIRIDATGEDMRPPRRSST